jgi:hypothetical protein
LVSARKKKKRNFWMHEIKSEIKKKELIAVNKSTEKKEEEK